MEARHREGPRGAQEAARAIFWTRWSTVASLVAGVAGLLHPVCYPSSLYSGVAYSSFFALAMSVMSGAERIEVVKDVPWWEAEDYTQPWGTVKDASKLEVGRNGVLANGHGIAFWNSVVMAGVMGYRAYKLKAPTPAVASCLAVASAVYHRGHKRAYVAANEWMQ